MYVIYVILYTLCYMCFKVAAEDVIRTDAARAKLEEREMFMFSRCT